METTSAIASATPSRTADSTAPSSRITFALIARSLNQSSSTPAYDVATRAPSRSSGTANRPSGAAKRNVDSPKPIVSRSSTGARESSTRSRPVSPTSSVPSPTYTAMSRGRR